MRNAQSSARGEDRHETCPCPCRDRCARRRARAPGRTIPGGGALAQHPSGAGARPTHADLFAPRGQPGLCLSLCRRMGDDGRRRSDAAVAGRAAPGPRAAAGRGAAGSRRRASGGDGHRDGRTVRQYRPDRAAGDDGHGRAPYPGNGRRAGPRRSRPEPRHRREDRAAHPRMGAQRWRARHREHGLSP